MISSTPTPELRSNDVRSRFSNSKALFEHLERSDRADIPSFYSPRPQRHINLHLNSMNSVDSSTSSPPSIKAFPDMVTETSASPATTNINTVTSPVASLAAKFNNPEVAIFKNNIVPPPVPPKPSVVDVSNLNNNNTHHQDSPYYSPTSPMSQVEENFNKMASDLDKMNHSYSGTSVSEKCAAFEPYWRDPSYYKKRYGFENGEEAKNGGVFDRKANNHSSGSSTASSESEESVPSEPISSSQRVSPTDKGATFALVGSRFEQTRSMYDNKQDQQVNNDYDKGAYAGTIESTRNDCMLVSLFNIKLCKISF
uniref:SoHo domain-containing protein n=1 Tax=Rhabditophanes sp. KR3021 TaxID=114890 RepID=A0AC35THG8_9BILA